MLLHACGGQAPKVAQPTAAPGPATPQATAATVLAAGVAEGSHGAVSAAEPQAAAAGLQVLRDGGNAIDAAVAVGFALAVTHPTAGNLGGGGFMVLRLADGTNTTIDYREVAPAAATPDMYLDKEGNPTGDSVIGPRAAGIPGTVAGLALAHQRFGKLPWARLLQPAIALAREGHALDTLHAASLSKAAARMREVGQAASASYFSKADGSPYAEGEVWKQPELAASLQNIADGTADAFYRGPFAERFAEQVKALGGIWEADDLARYQPVEREPLRFEYAGHTIITMPPPSSGGVVLRQILGASALLNIAQYPWHSVTEEHLYLEAARRAFADRNFLLGDPDFVQIPIAQLTDLDYIRGRIASVDPQHATPSDKVAPGLPAHGQESHDTTHYSVVDGWGNAVANTYTLNTSFGSKVIVPGTGILLNNEMNDFATKPGSPNVYGLIEGQNNRVMPRKRPMSSMSPTIVTQGGRLRAVLGSPGGPTIITTVAQLLRALIDYQQPLEAAVTAPRLHHQWQPDRVFAEPQTPAELLDGLRALGHSVELSPFGPIGHANCIEVEPETHVLRAVADVTRGKGGSAQAY